MQLWAHQHEPGGEKSSFIQTLNSWPASLRLKNFVSPALGLREATVQALHGQMMPGSKVPSERALSFSGQSVFPICAMKMRKRKKRNEIGTASRNTYKMEPLSKQSLVGTMGSILVAKFGGSLRVPAEIWHIIIASTESMSQ